jgi:hypothetical protein
MCRSERHILSLTRLMHNCTPPRRYERSSCRSAATPAAATPGALAASRGVQRGRPGWRSWCAGAEAALQRHIGGRTSVLLLPAGPACTRAVRRAGAAGRGGGLRAVRVAAAAGSSSVDALLDAASVRRCQRALMTRPSWSLPAPHAAKAAVSATAPAVS